MMSRSSTYFALIFGVIQTSAVQFKDLDFEEADTAGIPVNGNSVPVGTGEVAKVMPGWRLTFGTNLIPEINVNLVSDNTLAVLGGGTVFGAFPEGHFALRIGRGITNSPLWTLQQTGMVPAGTMFLVYRVLGKALELHMNGEVVPPLNAPPPGPTSGWIGVTTNLFYDVSRFAGLDVTLALVGPEGYEDWFGGGLVDAVTSLDSIRFVTEPSPTLQISQLRNQVVVSWPASTSGYSLQSADSLSTTNFWMTLLITPVVIGDAQTVTLPIDEKRKYYRLSVTCDGCGQ
jgi:hypothetical protein